MWKPTEDPEGLDSPSQSERRPLVGRFMLLNRLRIAPNNPSEIFLNHSLFSS